MLPSRSSSSFQTASKATLSSKFLHQIRKYRFWCRLAPQERKIWAADLKGLGGTELGAEEAVHIGIAWLCKAQDFSMSRDGGVSAWYNLAGHWAPSYPETTGYIIPTFLQEELYTRNSKLRIRAKRMLDWLVRIQSEDGSFNGSLVNTKNKSPTTFNTGQILLGLVAGVKRFEDDLILNAMHLAARWLRDTQDDDGCWRRFPSALTISGDKAYETHAAWGLFEADKVSDEFGYGDAGLRQIRWALTKQRRNGWFSECCLSDPERPLTHTIGYALRGILEGYKWSRDRRLLKAAELTGRALASCLSSEGFLAGRLDSQWQDAVGWACLTGTAQIAHCWFDLFEMTGDKDFLHSALLANSFVRRTINTSGPLGVVGGVKGSFPISGGYLPFCYPNWATKFFVDANRSELLRKSENYAN